MRSIERPSGHYTERKASSPHEKVAFDPLPPAVRAVLPQGRTELVGQYIYCRPHVYKIVRGKQIVAVALVGGSSSSADRVWIRPERLRRKGKRGALRLVSE